MTHASIKATCAKLGLTVTTEPASDRRNYAASDANSKAGLAASGGSEHDRDKHDCVILRCGGCNRVVYAGINEPRVMDTEQYKEIGKMVAQGCTVEHMTTAEVRKSDFGCKCDE